MIFSGFKNTPHQAVDQLLPQGEKPHSYRFDVRNNALFQRETFEACNLSNSAPTRGEVKSDLCNNAGLSAGRRCMGVACVFKIMSDFIIIVHNFLCRTMHFDSPKSFLMFLNLYWHHLKSLPHFVLEIGMLF